jgi:hypothetical protein
MKDQWLLASSFLMGIIKEYAVDFLSFQHSQQKLGCRKSFGCKDVLDELRTNTYILLWALRTHYGRLTITEA